MLSMLSWLISFIYNPQTHKTIESIDKVDETKDFISVESNEILDNDGNIVEHFTKKTEDFNIKNMESITEINNKDINKTLNLTFLPYMNYKIKF